MVIAIIVLSILLVASLLGVGILIYLLNHLMNMKAEELFDRSRELFEDWTANREVEEEFPCTLIATTYVNCETDGYAYDFSKYEENQIIGLTLFSSMKTPKDQDLNDFLKEPSIIPQAVVYKYKDGGFSWKQLLS